MNQLTLIQKVREKLINTERMDLVLLSGRSGVGIDTIQRIKSSADYDPSYRRVQRLADALGVK